MPSSKLIVQRCNYIYVYKNSKHILFSDEGKIDSTLNVAGWSRNKMKPIGTHVLYVPIPIYIKRKYDNKYSVVYNIRCNTKNNK